MPKKNKRKKKFGLASGIHSSKRKILRGKGSQKRCKPAEDETQHFQQYVSPETGRKRKRRVTQLFDNVNKFPSGYRFVNLGMLQAHVMDISKHAALCMKAHDLAMQNVSPIELAAEISSNGLASVISVKCKGCEQQFLLNTSPTLNISQSSQHYDINVRAVWGALATGNGNAHLNELLACVDSPGLGQRSYQTIEQEINRWWRDILQKDLDSAIEEEKRIAIKKGDYHQGIPAITVICDGGWSKRSHKHSYNGLGGVAIIIGQETKKLLHIGVRNKQCSVCTRAESLGCPPRGHDCYKNWDQSSQAMEADIIVEGFLKANDYGVRYMRLIGDGDSSVFANIREKVPVWGCSVSKLECANHACKCLRNNLEKLVDAHPHFKGRGKLTKQIRIRLVTAVRCAIRMRSSISNRNVATKLLAHDIRNSVDHIYGEHANCSEDFCKAKMEKVTEIFEGESDADSSEDVISEQASLWSDGASLREQEEARYNSNLKSKDLDQCSDLRREVAKILNRVAEKSERLIRNFTTNLAECWMHIRTKYDGGKVFNHCNRWSWNTRCYAGALRLNIGPQWSLLVWEQCTSTRPGRLFSRLYKRRETNLDTCKRAKAKPHSYLQRMKRKRTIQTVNSTKKARLEYGEDARDIEEDISPQDLDQKKAKYMETLDIRQKEIEQIESTSKGQSESPVWKEERKKRLTSSEFGKVVKRNTTLKVEPLVRQLLYSNFKGNRSTRIGLCNEEVSKQEYLQLEGKENLTIEPSGLVIDATHKFLACSPDGVINNEHGKAGLIEIKNVLYDKPITLTTAATLKNMQNFCLELVEGHLRLKQKHNYFYQCQGQLNITNLPWCDFVVRTDNPYELHVERIHKDSSLWHQTMIPKLEAFFDKAILPELAAPRHGKNPGIHEPGVWYNTTKTKTRKGKPVRPASCSSESDDDCPTTSVPVVKDATPSEPLTDAPAHVIPIVPNTRGSRARITKFVGRTISHQWLDEEKGTSSWYNGTVLSLTQGRDGSPNAEYQIAYEHEDGAYDIDHLVEDYRAGLVKFIDI